MNKLQSKSHSQSLGIVLVFINSIEFKYVHAMDAPRLTIPLLFLSTISFIHFQPSLSGSLAISHLQQFSRGEELGATLQAHDIVELVDDVEYIDDICLFRARLR